MSNEHRPTGREGVTTDDGTSVSDEQSMTGDDLDQLFEVLANGQRRRILAYLDEGDSNTASFSELIEHVAEDVPDESDEERLAMQLHHAHLPKLADANLVEYDTRSEMVRYRGSSVISDWLTLVRAQESNAP